MRVLSLQVSAEFGLRRRGANIAHLLLKLANPQSKKGGASMKAYSQDLRERVLRAVDQGYPRAEIVQFCGISLSTLKRYLKQRREEGHVTQDTQRGISNRAKRW
jgi:DNA invertase Pin-like site-specific DNA recombinase